MDGRTIPVNSIIQSSSLPIGYSCVFLFESELFHAKVDSSRQSLLLPDGLAEGRLFKVLRGEIGKVLTKNIPQISEKNARTIAKFEDQFPHLLGYFDTDTVGIIDRDEALSNAQQKFFGDQKEILQSEKLSDSAYRKSLELSSRALTEYILYRRKIIDRLKEISTNNSESELHNLIVPRFKEFSQEAMPSEVFQNNAWLLDDKFMVFRTVLSEKRMNEVIKAIESTNEDLDEPGRPDIAMIFSSDPASSSAVDVVVVEVKKKTDDEKENYYAILQLLERAEKLAAHCPALQRIWYYAVIQISDTLETRLRQQKWAPLFSKGKVFYQEYETSRPNGDVVPTPMFVVSFDAIVADAESRNHTFLEILRAGMKNYAAVENGQSDD